MILPLTSKVRKRGTWVEATQSPLPWQLVVLSDSVLHEHQKTQTTRLSCLTYSMYPLADISCLFSFHETYLDKSTIFQATLPLSQTSPPILRSGVITFGGLEYSNIYFKYRFIYFVFHLPFLFKWKHKGLSLCILFLGHFLLVPFWWALYFYISYVILMKLCSKTHVCGCCFWCKMPFA